MLKKNQKFPRCGLQELVFEVTNILFLAMLKNRQLHFTRSHLYEKNIHDGGASLDSIFKASWLHA